MSSRSFSLPASLLPSLVGVLSTAGLLGGIYNFAAPLEGARGFGLLPTSPPNQLTAFQKAYIRIHGIRNIGIGLGNFSLLTYWYLSDSPIVRDTVRRCIGWGLVMGTVVGMGDAYILKAYAGELTEASDSGEKDVKEAKDLATSKGTAHAITGLIILGVGFGLVLG